MTTHPNVLSATDSLLVVVDLQSKLSAVMSEMDAKQVSENTGKLLQASGFLKIPVLLTEQYPIGLGPTDGAIIKNLPESIQFFEKTGFSCCAADGFCGALENNSRKQIVLVGQEAHVCILQTALQLLHIGYQVYVVEDAVCSRKMEHKFYALQRMQQQGVTLCNVESVLFEWLRDSAHPEFKAISSLVR